MKYQTSKKKVITGLSIFLAFLLLLSIGLGIVTDGFKNWNVKEWFNKVDSIPGGGVVDGDGNEMNPGKVYEMPSKMVFTSATGTALSDGITVSAVIEPIDATDKYLSWSAVFVNPTSVWATGKIINTYFEVTPTSPGSLTAKIKCLQAFGEQIKIIVSSRENPLAKAECTVDYAKRFNLTNFTLSNQDVTHDYNRDGKELIYLDPYGSKYGTLTVKGIYDYAGQVGTIEDTAVTSAKIAVNPLFKGYYESDVGAELKLYEKTGNNFEFNEFFYKFIFGDFIDTNDLSWFNSCYDAVKNGQGIHHFFDFTLTLTGKYSTVVKTYELNLNLSDWKKHVLNITFDDSTIIF